MDLETPVSAYQIRLRLKKKWMDSFRNGIPLPTTKLLIQSSQTRHVYHIQNATAQSPLVLMPDLYTIDLPTSRMGDFTWFYIEVYNPFKFPVSFSIREPNGKSTSKKQTFSALNFMDLERSSSSASVTSLAINSDGLEESGVDVDSLESEETIEETSLENENQGRIVSVDTEGTQTFSFFGGKSSPSNADNRREVPKKRKTVSSMQKSAKGSSSYLNREIHHQSNRRFSIIQGATMHSQSSRFKNTAIKADNGDFISPSSDSPYVVHSLSSTEWVALPFSKSRIGPILINPKLSTPESRSGVFYVFNNFTGFDKVEVRSSFGHPKMIVSDAFASSPPCDNLCSFTNRTSLNVQSTGENKWEVNGVIVSKLSEQFLIGIRNVGDVSANVLDIIVDGESCDSFWNWIASLNGVGNEPSNIFCKYRPIPIQANSSLHMIMMTPTLCIYAKNRGSLAFIVEGQGALDSRVEIAFDFTFSPEVSALCIGMDGISTGYQVFLKCCVIGVMVLLLVLCANNAVTITSRLKKHKMNMSAGFEHLQNRKSQKFKAVESVENKFDPVTFPAITIPNSVGGIDLSDVCAFMLETSPSKAAEICNLTALITAASAGKGTVRIKAVETLLAKRKKQKPNITKKTPLKPKLAAIGNAAAIESSPTGSEDLSVDTNHTPNMTTTESSRNNSTTHNHSDSIALATLLAKGKEKSTKHLHLRLDENFSEPTSEAVDRMGSSRYNVESPEALSISGTTTSTDAHSRESSLGSNILIQDVYASAVATSAALNGLSNNANSSGKLRSVVATPPISPSGNVSSASSFIAVQTKKTLKLSKVKTTDNEVVVSGEANQHHRSSSQSSQTDGSVSKSPIQLPTQITSGGSDDAKWMTPLSVNSGIAEETSAALTSTRSSSTKVAVTKPKTPVNSSKPPSHGGVHRSEATISVIDVPTCVSLSSLPSKARAPIGEPTDSFLTIIADVRASLTQENVLKVAEANGRDASIQSPPTPGVGKPAWTLPPALPDYLPPAPQNDELSPIQLGGLTGDINPAGNLPSILATEMDHYCALEVSKSVSVDESEKIANVFASHSILDDDADDIDAIFHVGMDDEHLALSFLPSALTTDINDSPLFYYNNNLLEGDDILSPVNDVAAFAAKSPSLEDMEFKKETELNPEAAPFETFASRTAHLSTDQQLRHSFYPALLLEPPAKPSTSPIAAGGGFHNDTLLGFNQPAYSSELGSHLGVGFDLDYSYTTDGNPQRMSPPHQHHRQQLQQPRQLNHHINSSRSGANGGSLLTSNSNRPRRTRYEDSESIFSSFFEDPPHNHFTNTSSSSNMSSESFLSSPPQAPPGLSALNNINNRLPYNTKANELSSHISFATNSNLNHSLYDSSNLLSRSSKPQSYRHSSFPLPGGPNSLSARMSSKLTVDSDALLDETFNADKFYNEFDMSDEEEGQEDSIIPLNANRRSSLSPQLRLSPTNNSQDINKTDSIFFSSRFSTSPTELTTMDTMQRGGWGISPPHTSTNSINRGGYLSSPSYRSQRVGQPRTGSSSVRTSREMLQPQAQTQIPSEYLRSANQYSSLINNSSNSRRGLHPLQHVTDEAHSNPNTVFSPHNNPSSKF